MIIDTKNKTIKIEGKVSLEELAGTIKELIKRFPKGEWKEYALEPYKNNFELEPIKIPYVPYIPYTPPEPNSPWIVTYTDSACDFELEGKAGINYTSESEWNEALKKLNNDSIF